MLKHKTMVHLVWGLALVLAGVGVFFRIPYVIPKIEKIEQFSRIMFYIRFCFYLMGVLLIGGGLKKIFAYYKNVEDGNANT